MKRKWLIGLASAAMVCTLAFGFAACGGDDTSADDAKTAQDAISAVKLEYLDSLGSTPSDFEVWGQTLVGEVNVPITWSAAAKDAGVTIGDYVTIGEKNATTGLVPISITRGEVDIAYTLTATAQVGEAKASTSFNCTIPLLERMSGDVSFDFKDVKYADYSGENYGKLDNASTLAILQAAGGADSSLTAVTATNLYGGTDGTSGGIGGVTDGYVKFGKSAEGGVLSLTFAKPVNKVQVKAQGWKDGSGDTEATNKLDKLSVNGSDEVVPDVTTPTVYTFNIEPATVVNIALTYRGFVFQVDVTFAPEGTHAHTPGTYTHDEGAWTHSTTCTDENCPDPTHKITADCEPVLNTCPVCDYEYNAEEILTKLEEDGVLKGTYSLTGLVQQDAGESDGDWSFYFEVEGRSIQARYCDHDGLTVLPKAGDTVTLEGALTVFGTNKTIQFNYGMVTDVVLGEGHGDDDDPDHGDPTGTFTAITAPVEGTEYYMGMNVQGTYRYLTGEMSGFYFETTTDPAAAAKVTLEQSGDGWLLKVKGQFIEIEYARGSDSNYHTNVKFNATQTSGLTWTWNEANKVFTMKANDKDYYLGSYTNSSGKTFETMSASELTYVGNSTSYPARLGTFVEGGEDDPGHDDPTGTFTAITSPEAGTEYYMSMKIADGKEHYITGSLDSQGFYLATTTELSGAAKVTLQADGEGWLIIVNDKYLELVESGDFRNPAFKATQTAGKHWEWDATNKIFTWTDSANTKWFLGTRNDKTFDTIGGCDYTKYVAQNYKAYIGTLEGGTQGGGGQPAVHVCGHVCTLCGKCADDECTDPVCEEKCECNFGTKEQPLSVSGVLALVNDKLADNQFTSKLVYVKGIANNTPSGTTYWSNLVLKDQTTSDTILVYSVNLRDAKTVAAPAQNDVLLICGYVKNYDNGTMEFATKDGVYVYIEQNVRGESTISLTNDGGATVAQLSTDNKVLNGTEISFTVTANTGKQIVSVKANNKPLTVEGTNTYKFVVAGDTVITVTTADEGAPVDKTVSIGLTKDDVNNNRKTYETTSHEIWEANGIRFTHTKGGSTDVPDTWQVRVYKDDTVKIELTVPVEKIKTIVFNLSKTDYIDVLVTTLGTIDGANVTSDNDAKTVTITWDDETTVTSYTSGKFTKVVWIESIDVTYVPSTEAVIAPAQVAIIPGKQF